MNERCELLTGRRISAGLRVRYATVLYLPSEDRTYHIAACAVSDVYNFPATHDDYCYLSYTEHRAAGGIQCV